MSGWPVRRRYVVFVLLPVLLCCCGGGLVGVPALWLVRSTVEAGKGAASPVAAADAYLVALGYNQREGLLPLLHDDTQEELLRQWDELRTAMAATDGWGAPNVLNVEDLDEGPVADGRATVEAGVSASWWGRGGTAGTSVKSETLRWRIVTREDDGWRVAKVEPPPWCGPGGYVVRCPGDQAPSVPPSASASPPADPQQHLRDMLPCGPNDPFRDMPGRSSCPSVSPS
jgi:hypothetical protein